MKHFAKSVNLLFTTFTVSSDPVVSQTAASHWGGEL
jgi:hypothetical protein